MALREIVLNDPTAIPERSEDDRNYSNDVFIIDQDGMIGVAFYNFVIMKWLFHTDTLVDYSEFGNETQWKWFYSPISLSDCGFL